MIEQAVRFTAYFQSLAIALRGKVRSLLEKMHGHIFDVTVVSILLKGGADHLFINQNLVCATGISVIVFAICLSAPNIHFKPL